MKGKTKIAFSLVLTLAFLLTLVGTAAASNGGNATVTPVSGDSVFSVTSVPVLQLPGQTTTAAGLIVPSGFPLGEKQFDGNGVAVSGLSYGFAKACFPISALNQGWGGKVGYWNGSAWKLLDTSISTPEESTFSWACATVSTDGNYALITWVVDASKLVRQSGLVECSFIDEYDIGTNYGYIHDEGLSIGLEIPHTVDPGSLVTYKIIAVDPNWDGEILSGTTGNTIAKGGTGKGVALFYDDDLTFSSYPGPAFMVRFTITDLSCYVDLPFEPYDGVR